MKNILRSILFEIKRSELLWILYILMAVFMASLSALISINGGHTEDLYISSPTLMFMYPIFIIGAVTGIVCCSGMRDKVANYEILAGHSREQFYFARFICSVLLATLLAFSMSFIPMIFGNIIFGWGEKLAFFDIFARQLLFVFPFVRLAAFFVCVSFAVKNELAMIAAGFGMCIATPVMLSFFGDVPGSVFVSIYNLNYLMDMTDWGIYNVSPAGIKEYKTIVSTINPDMVTGTIAVSLLMTVIYMILGYGLFRRSDLD